MIRQEPIPHCYESLLELTTSRQLLMQKWLTLHAIASQEHVTPGYVSRLLRLSSLAPDIITAIVIGKNPPQLTAKKLMRLALEIPVDWTAQRKLLGFHAR